MQFLYPSFLWALLVLAIPIIIHLFYFRRFKKVYFTNVKFLKEIKEETSNRNKIKNLLVLLSRLLAFAALVLAFAQPFLPAENGAEERSNAVSIFLDNSYSMQALSEDVPLIEKAKKKAKEIVSAFNNEDKFQIISHDLEARHQRLVSKEDALTLIDEIAISPEVKALSRVRTRQNQVLEDYTDGKKSIYLISDFQKIITDISPETDSTIVINLLPFQSVKENNVSIDSAWFLTPVPMINQVNKLVVKTMNHGSSPAENVRLSMMQGGQNKPIGLVQIDANSYRQDTINVSITQPGIQNIEINITDYPVQFDDKYKLSFKVPENIKVLSINNGASNRYLNALFNGLNYYSLKTQNTQNISYTEFPTYNFIILDDLTSISSGLSGEIASYIKSGGNVMVFPSANVNKESYNKFLNQCQANNLQDWSTQEKEVYRINTDEFVFQDVFGRLSNNLSLPKTTGNYNSTDFSTKGARGLLYYRDGSKYMSAYKLEKGNLFVCASPLNTNQNDLVQKAEVFVPLIYKASIYSGDNKKIAYTIGQDELIEIQNRTKGDDLVYTITGKQEFIPGQTNLGNSTLIDINNMIKEEGFYNLSFENKDLESFAFNYDRMESSMDYYSIDQLKEKYGDRYNIYDNVMTANFTEIIEQKEKGTKYWKWFLILALIFLLIETLLLRFWKTY